MVEDLFFDGAQLVTKEFRIHNELFVHAQMSQGMSSLQRIIESRVSLSHIDANPSRRSRTTT